MHNTYHTLIVKSEKGKLPKITKSNIYNFDNYIYYLYTIH